jgi:hypothetical protein
MALLDSDSEGYTGDSLVSLGVPRKVDNTPSPSFLPTAPIIPPSTIWTKIVDTAQSRLSILKRLSGAFSPMGLGTACSTFSPKSYT